jgi:hypothetical protein
LPAAVFAVFAVFAAVSEAEVDAAGVSVADASDSPRFELRRPGRDRGRFPITPGSSLTRRNHTPTGAR